MTGDTNEPALLTSEEGAVLVMRINRPRVKNALNRAALRGLAEAYTRLSHTPHLRCGILHGAGDVFCAGLDLADVLPASVTEGSAVYLGPEQTDPFGLWGPACAKPVVVAVHGRCYTAGLELALAADLCVAAEGTVFGQQETTRGIMPLGGATIRLPQRIGWGRAMDCMLAGGQFDANQALAWGLVSEIARPDELIDRARAIAERICACAPLAVQATLANARLALWQGPKAAAEHIRTEGRGLVGTADAREGMMSMIERRAARFVGA